LRIRFFLSVALSAYSAASASSNKPGGKHLRRSRRTYGEARQKQRAAAGILLSGKPGISHQKNDRGSRRRAGLTPGNNESAGKKKSVPI
jgi:hypothetical protein